MSVLTECFSVIFRVVHVTFYEVKVEIGGNTLISIIKKDV